MDFEDWKQIITIEKLDSLKRKKGFKFCKQSLYKHFGVSQKMLAKLLDFYKYDIKPLTSSKKLTTREWIERSNKKHNYKFDYSKSVYIDTKTKVEIICKKHGSFLQAPSAHMNRGDDCPKCGLEKRAELNRTSLEYFIKKANIIHNNKFDYSFVKNFKRLNEKFTIICPKHGKFEVVGSSHLQGYDCEKCSYEKRGVDYSISKKEMIERFSSFRNELTYDLSNYKNTNSIIKYTCPIHGELEQRASKHLKGKGCFKCNRLGSWNKSNTEEFIEKAKNVHKGYYSYDKATYEKNSKKVVITCPHHGDFEQRPNTHLLGAGCKVCANITSNFKDSLPHKIEESKYIDCELYIMYFPKEGFYKIGISRHLKKG